MRKLVSILLIALLLFNVLGYYGLFIGLRYKVTNNLIERLNTDQYSENETFTLKIPLAVPYHGNADEYERVDGEIEHRGEFYRLVKQKLSKDTLFVVCLKDIDSKNIAKAFVDYVKTFTDKPVGTKQTTKAFSGFIKDYLPTSVAVMSLTEGWTHSLIFTQTKDLTCDLYLSIPSPPPKYS